MSKVTEWFSGDVMPIHEGVYQRLNDSTGLTFYARWLNGYWRAGACEIGLAAGMRTPSVRQVEWKWRGLREPA